MRDKYLMVGLVAALFIAGFISLYASTEPDGLERIAKDYGFLEKGEGRVFISPMPSYVLPGIGNGKLSSSLAGVIGTLIIFVLLLCVGTLLKRKSARKKSGMDSRLKIILCLSFILCVVSINPKDLVTPLYFFPILIVATLISGVSVKYIINRVLAVIPFTLFVALGILVTGREGGIIFLSVLMKSILSVSAVSLLVATASFQNLIKGFRGLHVPNIMLLIISFMHRYQDVIANEVKRMETAMRSRGGSRGSMLNLRAAGNIIGNLFIRSYHRSDRVYVAMTSRGFDSKKTWTQ